jgi:transcriptional regulator with XRE-family HTH domain
MGLGNKETMAENIKYYIEKNGITVGKMVSDLNFKKSTVYTWLAGETYPRIDKIEMMANYFGIEKSDLVEKRDERLKEEQAVNLDKALSENGIAMFQGKPLSEEYKQALLAMLKTMNKE